MHHLGRVATALAIASAATIAIAPAAIEAAPSRVLVAYYSGSDIYGGDPYYLADIPPGDVTQVDYAFGAPTADGTCALTDPNADYQHPFPASHSVDGTADASGQALKGNFNQLRELKAAHPGLKAVISIGGWTLSKYFSDVAATAASRQKFVKSCIGLFIKGNLPIAGSAGGQGAAAGVFDGIDIDWEFPVHGGQAGNHHRPSDKSHVTLLFKEFRRQLDALGSHTGRHYLLTAAIPGGNQMGVSYDFAAVAAQLDWIGVMSYDYHGSYEETTNFDSPFKADPDDPTDPSLRPAWNIRGTVKFYRDQGVPASKIVLGVPFYGVEYIRVGSTDHGVYQAFDNSGLDNETPTYRDLVDGAHIVTSPSGDSTPTGLAGYTRYWSDAAGEPWLWNPSTSVADTTASVFITYEDRQSIAERVGLIKSKNLRGAMVWEISQDNAGQTLIGALSKILP